MSGVHRSARISDARATGQYCLYFCIPNRDIAKPLMPVRKMNRVSPSTELVRPLSPAYRRLTRSASRQATGRTDSIHTRLPLWLCVGGKDSYETNHVRIGHRHLCGVRETQYRAREPARATAAVNP